MSEAVSKINSVNSKSPDPYEIAVASVVNRWRELRGLGATSFLAPASVAIARGAPVAGITENGLSWTLSRTVVASAASITPTGNLFT